jgi:3-hydroxy-9,10-secoandrosta-1,3,5(10)-triene-9,17-dione monooxygenase
MARPAPARIPQPEPGLTSEALVQRARGLKDQLRAQQDEADERGWYTDEVHKALLDGGFYRIVQPKMFGGYEFDTATLMKVVIEIGRGHPSSAWCYCLASSHAMVAGSHFDAETQAELFGPTGDFRAPHRAPPAGKLERVEGGYRVNGSWNYSSGSPVCTHFMGGAVLPRGEGRPRNVDIIVPRDQIEIIHDWGGERNLGMRGSGSNTVKLTDVFVPDNHIVDQVLLTLPDWSNGTPGARLHGNPMYLGVPGGVYHATFTSILTGTAYAAIDEYEEIMRKKSVMGRPDVLKMDDPASQAALGEALAMAHAAEAIAISVGEQYMAQGRRWQETGQPITPEDTLKLWATAQKGCYLACEAVEKLFRTASASSTHRGQRMQRYFRDIQMYLVHPSAQPIVSSLYAQNYLGLAAGLPGTS